MTTKLLTKIALVASTAFSMGTANAAVDWEWNLTTGGVDNGGGAIITNAYCLGSTSTSSCNSNNIKTNTPSDFNGNSVPMGNTKTYSTVTAGAPVNNVEASAWANTGNGMVTYSGSGDTREYAGSSSISDSGSYTIESAYLAQWGGGLGVYNRDATDDIYRVSGELGDKNEETSPEHAVDNNQRNDMVLFSFDEAVSLTQVGIGWYGGDSDITVMAYTGSGTPAALTGQTYSGLVPPDLDSGWTLINHFCDVAAEPGDKVTFSTTTYSSYWLIGAYNSYVGGSACTDKDGTHCGSVSDAVKISLLAGNKKPGDNGNVPEPGTLGLLGLGLLGLVRARRSKLA